MARRERRPRAGAPRIAKVIYEWLAEYKRPPGIPSARLPALRNKDGQIVTIRVDTKVVQESDADSAKSDEVAWMRRTLDTVRAGGEGGDDPEVTFRCAVRQWRLTAFFLDAQLPPPASHSLVERRPVQCRRTRRSHLIFAGSVEPVTGRGPQIGLLMNFGPLATCRRNRRFQTVKIGGKYWSTSTRSSRSCSYLRIRLAPQRLCRATAMPRVHGVE